MLSAIDPLAVVRSAPQAALRGVLPVALPRPWRVPVQRGALAAQRLAWLGALGALLLLAPPVQAQDGQAAPLKAESPYFFVQGAQPGVEALPLKRTDVHAHVSGVIADVVVTQHYRNEGQVPIEARYIFPGGTHAAVNGMVVRVGKRRVVAQIREKQAARIEYDAARREGKTAALLEQHRPNVFQMNVANILPGDEVDVELRYNELLVPTDGQYQFVFPTVVGPRYALPRSAASHAALPPEGALAALGRPGGGSTAPERSPADTSGGQPTPSGGAFPAQPVLHAGQPSPAGFTMQVDIDSPLAIHALASSSHAIDTQVGGDDGRHARVQLARDATRGAANADNRDFILGWRLAGDAIQSGVLLQRGEKENFFLAMVQPPRSVAPAQIAPRDYIFVVDISGSMHGFPLDTAKALMRQLLGNLRPSDRFNVLLFAGSNRMLSPQSVPATPANVNAAIRTIEQMGGSGSTELLPALRRVYAEPKTPDLSRTVVVVTDGYVTVEDEAFALVRGHLGQANLFAFGIGSSVNRHLMEGLARAGMGEPFVITRPDEAKAQAERFRKLIESPVLTSVQARFEGLEVYDVEPPQLPDVLAERPVIVFGKWRAPAAGRHGQPRLVVEGQGASGPYRQELPVDVQAAAGQDEPALRFLWARHRIASLSDQEALTGGDAQKAAITRLGLDYSLLTQYTSFIAVDQVVRNPGGQGATSNQPSPMPEGVTDRAVGDASALGAAVASTPEPETWAAMLVVLAVLGAQLVRRRRRHPYTA